MKPRSFALIPAAGHSVRMGEPKLLLPIAGQPLIAHTLGAWLRSKVDHVLVVVRPDDEALASFIRGWDTKVDVVIPTTAPPDMKASVQAALRHIEAQFAPQAADRFLVAPADMPELSTAVIDRLITRSTAAPSSILVPTLHGKQGHPVLFPWSLAALVHHLPAAAGLKALTLQQQPTLVPCDDLVAPEQRPFCDVDTPAEYRRFSGE